MATRWPRAPRYGCRSVTGRAVATDRDGDRRVGAGDERALDADVVAVDARRWCRAPAAAGGERAGDGQVGGERHAARGRSGRSRRRRGTSRAAAPDRSPSRCRRRRARVEVGVRAQVAADDDEVQLLVVRHVVRRSPGAPSGPSIDEAQRRPARRRRRVVVARSQRVAVLADGDAGQRGRRRRARPASWPPCVAGCGRIGTDRRADDGAAAEHGHEDQRVGAEPGRRRRRGTWTSIIMIPLGGMSTAIVTGTV